MSKADDRFPLCPVITSFEVESRDMGLAGVCAVDVSCQSWTRFLWRSTMEIHGPFATCRRSQQCVAGIGSYCRELSRRKTAGTSLGKSVARIHQSKLQAGRLQKTLWKLQAAPKHDTSVASHLRHFPRRIPKRRPPPSLLDSLGDRLDGEPLAKHIVRVVSPLEPLEAGIIGFEDLSSHVGTCDFGCYFVSILGCAPNLRYDAP